MSKPPSREPRGGGLLSLALRVGSLLLRRLGGGVQLLTHPLLGASGLRSLAHLRLRASRTGGARGTETAAAQGAQEGQGKEERTHRGVSAATGGQGTLD